MKHNAICSRIVYRFSLTEFLAIAVIVPTLVLSRCSVSPTQKASLGIAPQNKPAVTASETPSSPRLSNRTPVRKNQSVANVHEQSHAASWIGRLPVKRMLTSHLLNAAMQWSRVSQQETRLKAIMHRSVSLRCSAKVGMVKLWKSPDLTNWTALGFVWKYGESLWHKPYLEKKKPLWAPEVHFLKGTFWLTYSMPGLYATAKTSGCGLLS